MVETDRLSQLLRVMPIAGALDIRCNYAGPWSITYDAAEVGVMRRQMVLKGAAVLVDHQGAGPVRLEAGEVVILPRGGAHALYDGSGSQAASPPKVGRKSRHQRDLRCAWAARDGLRVLQGRAPARSHRPPLPA